MINKDKYEIPDQSILGYLNLSEYGFLFLEDNYNNSINSINPIFIIDCLH